MVDGDASTASAPDELIAGLGQPIAEGPNMRLLASGRSSEAWLHTHEGVDWIVRLPIPGSGRLLSYRSEAQIGRFLTRAGHPVAAWWSVTVGGLPYSIGRRLPGQPLTYDWSWTERFAGALAHALHSLHTLPCDGFGPLADVDDKLHGMSETADRGIIDRWFHARIWPFDDESLEGHDIHQSAPGLAATIVRQQSAILEAAIGPYGVVHSDLHREHLLSDGSTLTGLLDFGDAFVGSTAWDFALLHWYYGDTNTALVATMYPGGTELHERGRLLAIAVGLYKLAKSPSDKTVVKRLRSLQLNAS